MTKKPIIGIPCNVVDWGGLPAHLGRDTFVKALTEVSGCTPLFIPATGKAFDFSDIAHVVDGILLTGSPSHVAPSCYGAKQNFEDKYLDPARDATTLPLIPLLLEKDIPLFAICRGFQEFNVATGGTLHQKVHELPGMLDHRHPEDRPLLEGYEKQAHKAISQKGGLFERWGLPAEFTVNTVHQQGVDRLGKGLHVEAVASDGLIEAVSVPGKKFALGTQWHPEGDYYLNPVSKRLFELFGQAVRK